MTIIDVSTGLAKPDIPADLISVSRDDVLSSYFQSVGQTKAPLPDDRSEAIALMSKALELYLKQAQRDNILAGVIGLGGSGGTSLISSALRSLPLGVPKVIVSTVASGQTQPYVGISDLILVPSVVDVCGVNNVSSIVLSNAGAAFAGMVIGRLLRTNDSSTEKRKSTVGVTMFGVTTPCVNAVKDRLQKEGFETLIFHATGVGGRAMESLVREGLIQVSYWKTYRF